MTKYKKIVVIAIIIIGISFCLGYFGFYLLFSSKSESSQTTNNQKNINVPTKDSNTTIDESSNSPNHEQPVKLIFIHHSTGENWLSDSDGQLGLKLEENNYFVSDTNYGWGIDSIGDHTDIGHWWLWFRSSSSSRYLQELYTDSNSNSDYSRLTNDPGGENEIIMFKSCFPNSNLSGDVDDPIPSISNNPLKGEDSSSSSHTISNVKGIYIDLLVYFGEHQDKLFVVVTAPPLGRNNTSSKNANNAREFNNWLVNVWLDDYNHDNVAVFDFYDVLTNYGQSNYAEFTNDGGDDHPSTEGNLLATEEFIPFLNLAYEDWKDN